MLYAAEKINKLLKKLEINNADKVLINEALTHPSYNFERNVQDESDYERLEFLGDSVLRLSLSHYLYDKYQKYDEGKLTKIRSYMVSDECLAKIAEMLKLGDYLNIGLHEEKDGGRKKESILACAMEAIFGAIYKSCGFETAKNCIYRLYSSLNTDDGNILLMYNPKEILQQYTQGLNKDLPEYIVINEKGPAHKKIYEIMVVYHGEEIGRGCAGTKKEAEKQAAYNAINSLHLKNGEINE